MTSLSISPFKDRPDTLPGLTVKVKTQCGSIYVTSNFLEVAGKQVMVEIFLQLGKAGSCQNSNLQGFAIALSHAARQGADLQVIAKELLGIQCPNAQPGLLTDPNRVLSCSDALGKGIIRAQEKWESLIAIEAKTAERRNAVPVVLTEVGNPNKNGDSFSKEVILEALSELEKQTAPVVSHSDKPDSRFLTSKELKEDSLSIERAVLDKETEIVAHQTCVICGEVNCAHLTGEK